MTGTETEPGPFPAGHGRATATAIRRLGYFVRFLDFAGGPATQVCMVYTGQAALVRAANRMSRWPGSRGHHGTHEHRRAGVPGSARTVTMPHRGGPDRINVTSLRFVGADRGCCCDESRGWGLICSWASMAIRVWRTGNPGEPRLRSAERTRGTRHLPRVRCRPMAATRSQPAPYVPLWR